ncbi:SDR family NAD(P)-dependent oxidoreductase [Mycolicibacterium komossense]|uniref:SDR family oxidoreductase n=1 Tax=Mycolicibacterium komossense TaxID=1779 RepID=A0ABT3CJ05_9MYCO|nr:SDR family oxidoreductase [Mycolicibacterium komossense]MCV7229483.1 SDR family oxidoreductase [Mycolicibacterium komossense]
MDNARRSAVVTGAASGIGLATARRLAAEGWALACVDTNETALAELVAELTSTGRRAVAVDGDVAQRDTHAKACAAAGQMAPLGAWIGVAGIAANHDLATICETDVRRLVDINQLGMLWGAIEALRTWESNRSPGVILVTSSVHGRHAAAGSGVYEMTKAAIEALIRNIAVTYGPQGIRAVAVAPGAISTPALQASFESASDPDAARRRLERHAPLNRLGETDEIAAAIAFLISPEASYVSGTTLTVDGAMSSVLMLPSEDPAAVRAK